MALKNTKKKPPFNWRAFEAAPGPVRAAIDWENLLGPDFEAAKVFLRLCSGIATAIPCPKHSGCGCDHAVVEHGRDDLVTVCQCRPKRCSTVPINRMDAVVYEVDVAAMGNAVAKALGVKPENNPVDELRYTWRFASHSLGAGDSVPIFLTLQSDSEDMRRVAEGLTTRINRPFVLMAPTDEHWTPETDDLLKSRKARFVPLADAITWNGKLSAKQHLGDMLAEFWKEVGPSSNASFAFECEGTTWRMTFRGDPKTVRDSKGMAYIANLLSSPNQEIHCTQFQGTMPGKPASSEFDPDLTVQDGNQEDYGSQQPSKKRKVLLSVNAVQDGQGVATYRRRLDELKEKIEEAQELGNTETAARLSEEQSTITTELARSLGYGGKLRREGPTKRARQAVSKAITAALKAIKRAHPTLHQHFESTIHLGEFIVYRPEDGIRWAVHK